MYANDADAIRDALCFFKDEKRGHEIAYVQHPQSFNNVAENDLYSNSSDVINQVRIDITICFISISIFLIYCNALKDK